jgi:hypothetical protein
MPRHRCAASFVLLLLLLPWLRPQVRSRSRPQLRALVRESLGQCSGRAVHRVALGRPSGAGNCAARAATCARCAVEHDDALRPLQGQGLRTAPYMLGAVCRQPATARAYRGASRGNREAQGHWTGRRSGSCACRSGGSCAGAGLRRRLRSRPVRHGAARPRRRRRDGRCLRGERPGFLRGLRSGGRRLGRTRRVEGRPDGGPGRRCEGRFRGRGRGRVESGVRHVCRTAVPGRPGSLRGWFGLPGLPGVPDHLRRERRFLVLDRLRKPAPGRAAGERDADPVHDPLRCGVLLE